MHVLRLLPSIRLALIALVAVVICARPLFSAEEGADVAKISPRVTAFLSKHCVQCHGPDEQNADIRLDTMSTHVRDDTIALQWQDILDVLNLGEMPPEEAEQPAEADLADVLETLTSDLRVARERLTDSGGHIVLRRLNRREYQRTIEALFGVPVDVSMLPEDETVDGFDTLGQVHGFSSLHLERYLDLGRQVLDDAYGDGKSKGPRPLEKKFEPEGISRKIEEEISRLEARIRRHDKQIAAGRKGLVERNEITKQEIDLSRQYLQRPETRDGVLMPFRGINPASAVSVGRNAATGTYRVRVRCGTVSEQPRQDICLRVVRGEYRADVPDELFHFQVTGTHAQPQMIEFTFEIDKIRSDRLSFERRSLVRDPLPQFAEARDYFFKYKDVQYLLEDQQPDLWIDWIEVEGPLEQPAAPLSAEKLFRKEASDPDASSLTDSDVPAVLRGFTHEAFRRAEPDAEYVESLLKVYREAREHGLDVNAALKDCMAVVLASPRFLFLHEPQAEGQRRRALDDRELAVRLSYFLWSSPPDEELYELAAAQKLRDPQVLANQVDRMIASPRADVFIETFTTQWLELERLQSVDPESTHTRLYDDAVKVNSRREVYAFFSTLLRENLPATNLLDSDFVVVNSLMADYYNIYGVHGDAFRKVALPNGSVRGGLLGQSAILTLTGTGQRTSPVERGAYVLRKLLHRPPPPAPANVPMLDEESIGTRSIRETLSIHKASAQCNSCHRRIDPLGFALENFDPVGRWRTSVPSTDGSVQFAIDPSGVMPDGERKFADLREMKQHLASEREPLLTGLTEAMMTYALGRTIGFTDQEVVEDIVQTTADDNFGMKTLVHQIHEEDSSRVPACGASRSGGDSLSANVGNLWSSNGPCAIEDGRISQTLDLPQLWLGRFAQRLVPRRRRGRL